MRYDEHASLIRPPARADYAPGGAMAPMAPMAPMDAPDTEDPQEEVPNDADFTFIKACIDLTQQKIKLCNSVLLQGQSDDVAVWAYEELMESTACLVDLNNILADLQEDKADSGADEDQESSARVAAKKKKSRRTAMPY